MNRLLGVDDSIEAHSVDEAVAALSLAQSGASGAAADVHAMSHKAGKRAAVAYKAYKVTFKGLLVGFAGGIRRTLGIIVVR